jgi:hypothetical protein
LSGLTTNYRGITLRDTNNNEQWFYGANDSNNFVIRRNSSSNDLLVSSSNGVVTIPNGLIIGTGASITMSAPSTLNMGGGNITGVGKISVASIDPLYRIGDKNYSTYASTLVGPIKEEYVGKGELKNYKNGFYIEVIDLNKVEKDSPLWLWKKIVDFKPENVDVFITPIGDPVLISYEINGNSIIFKGKSKTKFSYRLVGNRFDWKNWPMLSKDQKEQPNFVIED